MKKDNKEQPNENLGVIFCQIHYERNPRNFRMGDLVLFHNEGGSLSYVHMKEDGPLREHNIQTAKEASKGLQDGTMQMLGAARLMLHIHQEIL